jgi:hypothetical protein
MIKIWGVFNEEPEYDPDELLKPDPSWGGGFSVGGWGYQVLREKNKKIKKNPIGFALPEPLHDETSISSNPTEDSNKL